MFYKKIYVFNANSLDPDQMPRLAASDLVCTVINVPFMERYVLLG